MVTKEKIEQIHEAGMEAGAWTVNDEATMARMLKMGIDRIYTDYPRRLLWQYGEGEGPFNGEIIVSPVYGAKWYFCNCGGRAKSTLFD